MAETAISFVIFFIGIALGSFANVLIYRWEKVSTIFLHPSRCPYCKHRLAWFDLIPIFSFFLLKGRCRYCGRPISWQYPAVELAVGLLAVALLFRVGLSASFVFFLLMLPFLVALFVVDLKTMILPDAIMWPLLGLTLLTILTLQSLDRTTIFNLILGAAAGAGFLGALYLLGRGSWIGFGDVKFGLVMGLLLRWPVVLAALFTAFLLGALVASTLLLTKKKTLQSKIPFGPFLVVGALIALLWGQEVLVWYYRAFP